LDGRPERVSLAHLSKMRDLLVPIDHIETLYELDLEYKEAVREVWSSLISFHSSRYYCNEETVQEQLAELRYITRSR
jgi:hypothetical protein